MSQQSFNRKRIVVCIAISIVSGLVANHKITSTALVAGSAGDFTYYWLAAKAVLAGQSPYEVVHAGGTYHLKEGFLYPLPAALIVIPFTLLSPVGGAVLFVTLTTALLAWCLTRDGYWRLPTLGSVPYFWFVSTGQLTPLIMCAAVIPAFGFLFLLKPNLGAAAFASRPSKKAFIGCVALLLISLLIQPHWPIEWIDAVRARKAANYGSPLLIPGGFVLLLGLLRWKRPEARLFMALSILPQSLLFYDQLLLWLIPQTLNESALLGITSFIGWFVATAALGGGDTAYVSRIYGPAILVSIYLPCLVMLLRRRNEFAMASPAARQRNPRQSESSPIE
jgi:hypothetical protein